MSAFLGSDQFEQDRGQVPVLSSTADQNVYRTEDNSGKKYGSIDKGEEVWVHQENDNMTQVTYEITKKTYGNVIKTGWVSSDKLEDHISIREEEMVLGVIADIALYNDRLDEMFLSVLGPNYKQNLTQSQMDVFMLSLICVNILLHIKQISYKQIT